jgi:hypothetical protein
MSMAAEDGDDEASSGDFGHSVGVTGAATTLLDVCGSCGVVDVDTMIAGVEDASLTGGSMVAGARDASERGWDCNEIAEVESVHEVDGPEGLVLGIDSTGMAATVVGDLSSKLWGGKDKGADTLGHIGESWYESSCKADRGDSSGKESTNGDKGGEEPRDDGGEAGSGTG